MLYHYFSPTQTNCVSCSVSLKRINSRYCPNPSEIEQHLCDKTGFDGHIKDTDKVCMSCYKFHLSILHQQKVTSTDKDLAMLIDSINTNEDKESVDSVVNNAVIKTVGQRLLRNEVILLSTAHNLFCLHATEIDSSVHAKELTTARCLLGHLSSHLGHHMSYSCKVRKYGTLVYRPNTDFVLAISRLLWEQRKPIVTEPHEHPIESPNNVNTTIGDLNKIVHLEIGKHLEEERVAPFDFNAINIDELIAQADKTLWNAICSITQSVRESRRSITMDDTQTHTKKVWRYFILCCILFCTDARCSRPLHQLITNVVEMARHC